jgi:hypothetical protein
MLPHKRDRSKTSRTRAALGEAREIYRRHSGAELVPSSAEKPAAEVPAAEKPAEKRPRPAALARQAASRIARERPRMPGNRDPAPDVHLNVPRLHLDRVDLKVDEVNARVALQAHILDLLRLDVGVDAQLRGLGLELDGVDAQAELDVRLEHLTTIVDRVMSTIDRNPQLLENLVRELGSTVDELGSNAARALRGDLPSRSAEQEPRLQPGDEPVD